MGQDVPHQCAWCTVAQEALFFVEDGDGKLTLDRLPEYSHICCPRCNARQRGQWRRERARAKAVLPLGMYTQVQFEEKP